MASRTLNSPTRRSHPSRPVAQLDASRFDPEGPSLVGVDPLAPVASPWTATVESPAAPETAASTSAAGAIRELADRAALQVAALRSALDQATRVEHAIANRTADLAQRLDQAARFEREMDRRLDSVGRSAGVLDQAGAALAGLERVIAELRGAEAGIETAMRRELEAQQLRVERLLAEQSEAFAARIAEISDQAARAVEGARNSAAAAESEASRIAATIERNVRAEADRLAAALERQGAAVQARVAIVIDDATQRLADLEQTGERVATTATERLQVACERAASVLGHDPRQAWMGSEPHTAPIPGSLFDITARAENAVKSGDDTVVRLSLATDRAAEIEAKVLTAIEQAASMKTADRLLEEAAAAEQRLTSLKDDLESSASSVRYNLSQAQQAEAILGKTVDRARDKAQSLDRAMDQVTEQATNMVSVARDVAGLVLRAEQVRGALSEVVDRAAEQTPAAPPRTAGRLRRAPFGPPAPHADESDDQSAAAA